MGERELAREWAVWFRKLDQARAKVERATEARRLAVEARNELVREAKRAGLPAAAAYERAGINQSTFSRQQGSGG